MIDGQQEFQHQRLLSLDPAGNLWGSERSLLDFIGDIPGFTAACCCPPNAPLIAKLKERNVVCFPTFQANLHLRGLRPRIWALCGLLWAILAWRPDVLHVNQAGATRIALLACRVFRIPCVVHVRLQEDVGYLNALRPSPRFLRQLIAISQPIADLLKAQQNLQEIPCTLLLDAYRLHKANSEANERITINWDFVCVGRFCESKGQEILLRSLHILQQRGSSPKCVFVGVLNDCGLALQQLAQDLGINDNVAFLGHLDDVHTINRQSRWLVCPSHYEPLGRVIFEAWDAGIPVVAGAFAGGAATSIQTSSGGLLFKEWTPASLAATLGTALATDPAARQLMAAHGRNWMSHATHPTNFAAAFSIILQNAIHSPKDLP